VRTCIPERIRRKAILDELLSKGWTHTEDGRSVYDLTYDELKEQAVLMAFREIDTENSENVWF
jgi:hypothetical protein